MAATGGRAGSSHPGRRPARRLLAWTLHALLLLALAMRTLPAAGIEKRLALVIGNASYPEVPLNNPPNDAHAVATTLRDLGFEVSEHLNLKVMDFRRVLREFAHRLQNEDAAAVFYYAGHGVQIDGRNYLLPVDINLRDPDEVRDDSVDIDELFISRLARARARVRIVILDACRDNPFEGPRTRGVRPSGGLAEMNAPGTLIAYSSAPGAAAEDGPPGSNSVFTRHLVDEMRADGVEVEQMFKNVRVKVLRDTDQRQTPWVNTSMTVNFSFNPAARAAQDDAAHGADARGAAHGDAPDHQQQQVAEQVRALTLKLEQLERAQRAAAAGAPVLTPVAMVAARPVAPPADAAPTRAAPSRAALAPVSAAAPLPSAAAPAVAAARAAAPASATAPVTAPTTTAVTAAAAGAAGDPAPALVERAPPAAGASPAAGPGARYDDAVAQLARRLFASPELARLRAVRHAPAALPLVIDPPIDSATGAQTAATERLAAAVVRQLQVDPAGLEPRAFTPESLAEHPLLLLGTLAASDRAGYRICLALLDTQNGRVVAQASGQGPSDGVDPVPTPFYRDAPAWAQDAATQGAVRTCNEARPGASADLAYVAQLAAAAQVDQATAAYDRGDFRAAYALFQAARKLPGGEQLRARNGLYLSSDRLGLKDEAAQAFARIVDFGLARQALAIKFPFRPGKALLAGDASTRLWLNAIARRAQQSAACLEITGHASRAAGEAQSERLALLRAALIEDGLEAISPELASRTEVVGKGARENLSGLGTDDLRDAVDRRIEFKLHACRAG